jgi:hypothetical protein
MIEYGSKTEEAVNKIGRFDQLQLQYDTLSQEMENAIVATTYL